MTETCVHCGDPLKPNLQTHATTNLGRCQSDAVAYGHLAHPASVPCRADGPNPCLGALMTLQEGINDAHARLQQIANAQPNTQPIPRACTGPGRCTAGYYCPAHGPTSRRYEDRTNTRVIPPAVTDGGDA